MKDNPMQWGFVANRVYFAMVREAQRVVDEGIATARRGRSADDGLLPLAERTRSAWSRAPAPAGADEARERRGHGRGREFSEPSVEARTASAGRGRGEEHRVGDAARMLGPARRSTRPRVGELAPTSCRRAAHMPSTAEHRATRSARRSSATQLVPLGSSLLDRDPVPRRRSRFAAVGRVHLDARRAPREPV